VAVGTVMDEACAGTMVAGKNSAAAADTLIQPYAGQSMVDIYPGGPVLTVTLPKGRPHYILVVQAMIKAFGNTCKPTCEDGKYDGYVSVNGVYAQPDDTGVSGNAIPSQLFSDDIPGQSFAPDSGTVWLDIDSAEAAHPGAFVGNALTVTLGLWDVNGNLNDINVSLVVTQQKK
jgi:hypothetical protein